MSEKKLRDKTPSPSTARLAIVENARKDAKEKMRVMAEVVLPTIRQLEKVSSEILKNTSPFAEGTASVQKQREDFSKRLASVDASPLLDRSVFVPVVPRTVQTAASLDYDRLAEKVAVRIHASSGIDSAALLYDSVDKELSREVLGKKLISTFKDDRDNKRKKLFEKLLNAKGKFVETEDLVDYLDCSDASALSKVVQAVNKKIQRDLHVSKIIKGQKGRGYRLNPDISIRRA